MTEYHVLASRPGHEFDDDPNMPVLKPGDILYIERGQTPPGFCDPCWDWFYIYRNRPKKCIHFSETGALRPDDQPQRHRKTAWQPSIIPSTNQETLA